MKNQKTRFRDLPLNKRKSVIQRNLWCWLFMSLTVIFYILFQGWPIVCSVWYSLLNWSGMTVHYTFVGLDNYKELVHDSLFVNAMANSFKYTVAVVPSVLVISLLLAYQFNNERLKCRSVYRTIYFLPVVTTAAIVGIIMIFIFSVNGPVNAVAVKLRILERAVNFLGDGRYALITVIVVSVWKDCGTYMIYWLAGLQSVPKDLYEAAKVDGASGTRVFFSIVLPMIAPTAGTIAILCTINSLKVFDLVKTMTEGGPFYATDVIATYVYRMAYSSEVGLPRLGYSSAAALVFGALVIFIGVVLNTTKSVVSSRRAEKEGAA